MGGGRGGGWTIHLVSEAFRCDSSLVALCLWSSVRLCTPGQMMLPFLLLVMLFAATTKELG